MNNIIGLQMPNTKFHHRYAVVLLIGAMFFVTFVNGCYQSFGDPYKFLHALMPAAIIIVLVVRNVNVVLRNWQHFDTIMIETTMDFYQKHESNPKYSKILTKRVNEIEFYIKLVASSLFLVYHLLVIYSFFTYIFTGQKMLCFNNFMIFTDPNETFGYLLNLSLFSIGIPTLYVAFVASDIVSLYFVYQLVPFCDILCCHIDELAEDLKKLKICKAREEGRNRWVTIREIIARKKFERELSKLEARFIDVIKEQGKYRAFVKDIIYFSEYVCMITIFCNSLSIGMSVVVFFRISMPLGVATGKFLLFIDLFFN